MTNYIDSTGESEKLGKGESIEQVGKYKKKTRNNITQFCSQNVSVV